MNFLTALGVDYTIIYLFGIYLVGFLTLYFLIYVPYYAAYQARLRRTIGGDEKAQNISQELTILQNEFNAKVREQREKVQSIFNRYLKQGAADSEKNLSQMRSEIEQKKNEYRSQLSIELVKQTKNLSGEVLHLAKLVQDKMELGG